MSSALPPVPTTARSMLEEMLAALKLRDEKPKDEPPSLPARPTLKRRPPSTKNNLKFKIESDPADSSPKAIDRAEKVAHSAEEDTDSHKEDSQKLGYVEEQAMVLSLRLEELEKVVADAKEELRRKEDENVALLQKVQVYETRCSVCAEKLLLVEDVYQKQIQSMKMALDEAQKNISTINMAKQQMLDGTPTTSGSPREPDDKSNNAVYRLTKELEKQKHIFEDDAQGFSKVKSSGQTDSDKKSMEELWKLKAQCASWKKKYNVRLHDAKKAIRKLAESEGRKPGRRWWCKRRRIIRNKNE